MLGSKNLSSRFAKKQSLVKLALLFGLIVPPGIVTTSLEAQGNLLITPRRVVFEGTKKNEDEIIGREKYGLG